MMEKPHKNEYNSYYQNYINLVEGDPLVFMDAISKKVINTFREMDESMLNYSYEEGKWTPKMILQHLVDVERVKAYRALCIARGDQTLLPGFDHDVYAERTRNSELSIDSILEQYSLQRNASINLLGNLTDQELSYIGNANESPLSARAVTFIIGGHDRHHLNVLEERYLKK